MDASRVPGPARVAGDNSAAATSALSSGNFNFREKDLTLRCLPTNGLHIVKMQGLSGLSHQNIQQHATHATMDDILRKEIVVPDDNQRYSIDATSVVWGNKAWVSNASLCIPEQMNILLAVLQALGILDIQLQMQVIATIVHAIGEILDSRVTLHTVEIPSRPLPNLIPGPDFNTSAPPPFHESNFAYLYWTISVVVWTYLLSGFVMSHFPSSYVSDLPEPRRVISLTHNYVTHHRKPDIAVVHHHTASRVSEWHQIASIGEVNWFMMMSSYSRRFCLGFTQCGPLLTLCLTDRGGNCTTKDVNASKAEDIPIFIQAAAHFTLAPDDELGDDQFFPTFSGSFEMTFPSIVKGGPIEYLNKLIIESRLFHSFSFTGKGTQVLLAKPAILSIGQYPQHVVVKDSWPTPAETHEAYLIRHIRECLTQTKCGQLHVDAKLHEDLTMLNFPDVLHEYFCQSVNPNTGELVHEATNVQRSCAVIDPNDGDVMMLQEMFERRLHYHLVFKDVVVDSTWFSSRREYLACIMHNLEAHRFAERVAQVLHKDIMPSNLWIVINNASAEAAVPGWVGNDPPLPRQAQLGDFGLGFQPSDSRKFAELLAEKLAKTCRIETGDGGGTGGLMCAGNATIKNERATELKDKPSQAMDRLGSPLYMSNETLADPFGQFIVHALKHDLEGFWWSILWVTINCEGPYGQLVDWQNDQFEKSSNAVVMFTHPLAPWT
ncbi:hypothetical protein DFH29DRAFT_1007645 [Suillus ampliporus]|nr:hypothetical protein DFH29DRAFT_1007645 [Suillus ampliporus]